MVSSPFFYALVFLLREKKQCVSTYEYKQKFLKMEIEKAINEILIKLNLRQKSTDEVSSTDEVEAIQDVVETPETVVETEKSEVETEKMDEIPVDEIPVEEAPVDETDDEEATEMYQLKALLAELAMVVESMGEQQKEMTEKLEKLSKAPVTVKAETKLERTKSGYSVQDRIKNFRKEFTK